MAMRASTKWPLGLRVLEAPYLADVDQHLLAFQQPHIERLGWNFSITLLGDDAYMMLDLESMESILAAKSEDIRL